MTPFVHWVQTHTKIPRGPAIFACLLAVFAFLTGLVIITVISVDSFVQGAPKYQESINQTLHHIEGIIARFNIDLSFENIRANLAELPLFSFAKKFTGNIFSFLGNLFLVFIFTIFMMTGKPLAKRRKGSLITEIMNKVSSYISTKFTLSVATGIIVWIILISFNVELAFIFGLLTVLLNFIPTIGSIIAVALPLPVLFLQFQFDWQFFVVLALTGVTQFAVGNVLEPKIMGDSMDLHPITILICLMFWGLIWGIPGMFLAVPISAILKIVFNRIEALKPFSEIMAGRIPSRSS